MQPTVPLWLSYEAPSQADAAPTPEPSAPLAAQLRGLLGGWGCDEAELMRALREASRAQRMALSSDTALWDALARRLGAQGLWAAMEGP